MIIHPKNRFKSNVENTWHDIYTFKTKRLKKNKKQIEDQK